MKDIYFNLYTGEFYQHKKFLIWNIFTNINRFYKKSRIVVTASDPVINNFVYHTTLELYDSVIENTGKRALRGDKEWIVISKIK